MKKTFFKNLFAFLALLMAVSVVLSVIYCVDAAKADASKTLIMAIGLIISQAAGFIAFAALSFNASKDAKVDSAKQRQESLSDREKTEEELARRSNKRYDMLVGQMEDNKIRTKNLQCLNCSHQKDSIFSCSIFQNKHSDILKGKERCEYFKGNSYLDKKDE